MRSSIWSPRDEGEPYGSPKLLLYSRLIINSLTVMVVVAAEAKVNDGMKFKSAIASGPVTLAEDAIAGAAPDWY
jgi:hypothetical protein